MSTLAISDNFTRAVPTDPLNLSPALAGLTAAIMVPIQYASIMAKSVLSVNQSCVRSAHSIDK